LRPMRATSVFASTISAILIAVTVAKPYQLTLLLYEGLAENLLTEL
jgi:hypothetical protein